MGLINYYNLNNSPYIKKTLPTYFSSLLQILPVIQERVLTHAFKHPTGTDHLRIRPCPIRYQILGVGRLLHHNTPAQHDELLQVVHWHGGRLVHVVFASTREQFHRVVGAECLSLRTDSLRRVGDEKTKVNLPL